MAAIGNQAIPVSEPDVAAVVGRFESEADLCKSIVSGIADIADVLGLPKVIGTEQEVMLTRRVTRGRRLQGVRRVDVMALHDDKSLTLIEAKNNATTTEIAKGVGQLLLYRADVLSDKPGARIHLVLATNNLDVTARSIVEHVSVGVHLLVVSDDSFAAVRHVKR